MDLTATRRSTILPTDHGGDRMLRFATLLYAIGLLAHTGDHLRRGTGVLTRDVFWAGMLSTAVGVATIVVVFMGHRLAPLLAALTGFPIALGVAAVHLLPHWSALSDAFPGAQGTDVNALSWTVVLVEIAGALLVGMAGVSALRRVQLQTATGS